MLFTLGPFSGTRPIPTIEEVLAEMPQIEWPEQ